MTARWVELDRKWFRRATESPSPRLDAVMYPLSRAADHGTVWFAAAALLMASGNGQLQRAAKRGTLALIITSIVANVGFKPVFKRSRPIPVEDEWRTRVTRMPMTTSFPSGHAASAAGFAIGAALEAPVLALPLGVVAAGVGWSRVRTRVHYPGDVLVGFAVGTAVALATTQWPLGRSTRSTV